MKIDAGFERGSAVVKGEQGRPLTERLLGDARNSTICTLESRSGGECFLSRPLRQKATRKLQKSYRKGYIYFAINDGKIARYSEQVV
jgi:hypothetical protein